jgi:hypothetical protein
MNFDDAALKLSHVTHALQIAGKNHHHKRAQAEVVTKIKVMNSLVTLLYPHHPACNASVFAEVFSGFIERKAVGRSFATEQGTD